MPPRNAGDLLAETLVAAGVRDVFGLHGGHLDSFLVGCRRNGIRLIDTRHEATAGHAAEAYARLTGRTGVATITAGPGFTNAFTSIVNAYLDSIPVLFITSSPPLREEEFNALQGGFSQPAVAAPVTKWAHRVTNAERIPDLVSLALRKAQSGRPGPVLLDIPIDVFFMPLDERQVTSPTVTDVERPAPAPGRVAAMLDALRSARRPAIIGGGGMLFPGCAAEMKEFADRTGIPFFTTGKAHGMLPSDHPANCRGAGLLGVLGMMGSPPDVVMLLGARQGLLTGGRSGRMIPHDATLIQVDTDEAELGRIVKADIPVLGGARETLRALLSDPEPWPDRTAWRDQAHAMAEGSGASFASLPAAAEDGRIHPFHAAQAIFDAYGSDVVLTIDGGETGAWAGTFARTSVPGGIMTNGYLGTLGVGPGYAIGAAVALPGTKVVSVAGDGAFGFHMQELDTMVRHELPVVISVFNNTVWGMSLHGQEGIYGDEAGAMAQLRDADYDKVAVALGGYGERARNFEEIGPAIGRAFASGLPSVVNVEVSPQVSHPIMPLMVGPPANPNDIVIPYYENIPGPNA